MRLIHESEANDPASVLIRAKGKDVQDQQKLFGSLVGLRVATQPVLAAINRLPANPFAFQAFKDADIQTEAVCEEVVEAADEFLASLLTLQELTNNRYDDTDNGDEEDDNFDSETEEEGEHGSFWDSRRRKWRSAAARPEREYVRRLAKRQKKVSSWVLDEADAWKSHCQPAIQRNFKALDQSISWQMKFAMNDGARLLSKSAVPAVAANSIGREFEIDHLKDENIGNLSQAQVSAASFERYDDKDLYIALLNSAVRGSAAKAGGLVSKQNADGGAVDDLERLRQLRAKSREMQSRKNVDRRASKGRKIRYKEIPKLVAFMAPMPRVSALDPEIAAKLVESAFKQESI